MTPDIVSCPVIAPSLARARELVPPDYWPAWNRYIEYEGHKLDRLPWHDQPMGMGLDVLLVSQRGIHAPDYNGLPHGAKGCDRYALTIHTSAKSPYADKEVIYRPDGTWILDYKAHRTTAGKKATDNSTTHLMNCLRDGIPVGVLSAGSKKGYEVLGLGYVEQYSYETDSFVIHGPVNWSTDANKLFFQLQPEELDTEQKELLQKLEETEEKDEKIKKLVEQVQRQGQAQFRQRLMLAYDYTCAATGEIETKVLQAAHIDPYRGKNSQVVTNGLLLRADIHLLYDADLLSVEPETHEIMVADMVTSPTYTQLAGSKITLPKNKQWWPDEKKLDLHHKQFLLHAQESAA